MGLGFSSLHQSPMPQKTGMGLKAGLLSNGQCRLHGSHESSSATVEELVAMKVQLREGLLLFLWVFFDNF